MTDFSVVVEIYYLNVALALFNTGQFVTLFFSGPILIDYWLH
jgi:hypothetical protein